MAIYHTLSYIIYTHTHTYRYIYTHTRTYGDTDIVIAEGFTDEYIERKRQI